MNGLNCRDCTEQLKQVRGHYGFDQRYIEGVAVHQCPMLYATPLDFFYLEGYRQFKAGFMPDPGGWLDQSNKFIEAIMFIDSVVDKMIEENKNGN